jgi:hypothetical protein
MIPNLFPKKPKKRETSKEISLDGDSLNIIQSWQKNQQKNTLKKTNKPKVNKKKNDNNLTSIFFNLLISLNPTVVSRKLKSSYITIYSRIKGFISFSKNKHTKKFNFTNIIFSIDIGIILSLILFVVYLSFFDSYNLVNNWEFSFENNSYLSEDDVKKLSEEFNTVRVGNVLPVNNFWFVSDQVITSVAKEKFNTVQSIQVIEKKWPDIIKLKVKTNDLLSTIKIKTQNRIEYWRIDKGGKIITLDTASLNEQVIEVQKDLNFEQANFDFADTSFFETNSAQLDRIYFAKFTSTLLSNLGFVPYKIIFPSLNSADKEVYFEIGEGTKLMFNSEKFEKNTHIRRLEALMGSTLKDEIKNNKLSYIDFRISRKYFVCYKNSQCENVSLKI